MSEGSPPSHRTADEAVRRHRASHHPLLVGPVELPSPRAALFMLGMRAHDGPADRHGRTRLLFAPEMRAASRMTTKPDSRPGRKRAGQVCEAGARSLRSRGVAYSAFARPSLQEMCEACVCGAWPATEMADERIRRKARPGSFGVKFQKACPLSPRNPSFACAQRACAQRACAQHACAQQA